MLLNPQNLSLTLFVSVLLFLAVTSVEANDFAQPHHRAHDNLKRLIRKRSPFPQDGAAIASTVGPVENVGGAVDPNAATATSTTTSAASASATASAATSASTTAILSVASSASSSSSSASASASISASASLASATASSTTSATTTSSTSPTAAAQQTTAAAQVTNAATPTTAEQKSTITHTSSVLADAAAATNSISPSSAASTKTKTTITTVLIVVAASVGGLAILWTVFRKWKLGHSSKFDERMAPIDWQPTNDEGNVPGLHRASSRASSFQSSSAHGNAAGAGAYGLEHDFSAPSANLAPVGGYADLARGSSPQPQMQEALGRGPSMRSYNDGLARGPSASRPAYDTGVPLHHQAGYGQAEAYDYNGDAVTF